MTLTPPSPFPQALNLEAERIAHQVWGAPHAQPWEQSASRNAGQTRSPRIHVSDSLGGFQNVVQGS